jgi:alkylation response protein AidB-like acyl-CoA dehydrogenase
MIATQSHGLTFAAFPATRFAYPGNWKALSDAAAPLIGCVFTAVIVGIVETAMEYARERLAGKDFAAYERIEWTRAQIEAFTVAATYEHMLRAVETSASPLHEVLLGKAAVAQLAESLTGRLCRIMGGGSYARYSPFGFWFEDVRALGWLRPPWPLMFDAIFTTA